MVLENIERLIGTGLDPRTATIKAMEEITGPIVAITLVLCSVFLPAAFITGITGQFFRQFALTIAAAMVISAINAMTLTPARAVTIFKTEHTADGHVHVREALPLPPDPAHGALALVVDLEHERLGENCIF